MRSILSSKNFCFAILFVGLAGHETDLIKEFDHTYSMSKSTGDLYALEEMVKKSLKVFPQSEKLFWRLGRVYFKLGEKSNNESEKNFFFSQCIAYTKKAIKINSKLASGYFFKGLCNGTLGEVQGVWNSLSTIEPFKKDMETTIRLDPSVEEGGPHRALGNLYLRLPYLLGGDLDLSIRHFEKAIQLGSEFGENYLGLAEAYIENGDLILAKDVINRFIIMELSSQKEDLVLEWKSEALKLLKKIQN